MSSKDSKKVDVINQRVREGGRFTSSARERIIIRNIYFTTTTKKGMKQVRRPNGQYASMREKEIYLDVSRIPVKEKIPLGGAAPDFFERGRYLKSIYFFNFDCECELAEGSKSPVTFVNPSGSRMVKHFFGFSTKDYTSDYDAIKRAKAAHDKSYKHHTRRKFKLVTKKRKML